MLYAQGRTTAGPKVTNANGGQSAHNYRLAFDFCPIVNGKAVWNNLVLFKRCGVIAEGLGLEWAGNWKSFPELAHCQDLYLMRSRLRIFQIAGMLGLKVFLLVP